MAINWGPHPVQLHPLDVTGPICCALAVRSLRSLGSLRLRRRQSRVVRRAEGQRTMGIEPSGSENREYPLEN